MRLHASRTQVIYAEPMEPRVSMADDRTQLFLDWVTVWEAVCDIEGVEYDQEEAIHKFMNTVMDKSE